MLTLADISFELAITYSRRTAGFCLFCFNSVTSVAVPSTYVWDLSCSQKADE